MTDVPHFAVVGHPNKGKSSIVSTLAGDDSVEIQADPRTTTRCHSYPMKVDGRTLYVLIDTPGFQRARPALAWMKERETTAAEHHQLVRQFVETFTGAGEYPDETELLRPVVEGAGILYVVDGSVPYGPEYEAEMKILRWTGQPSMGLINPIGPADHIADWRAALQQYFSVVRVFNAVHSSFTKRIELLRAFGALREEWRAPLEEAVDSLVADRERRRGRAARRLAASLAAMLTHRIEAPFSEHVRDRLEKRFLDELRAMEGRSRDGIEEIYDHRRLSRQETALEQLGEQGLFSDQTWAVFGLNRGQILGLGALGGATIGGIIDAGTGGSSMLLGTLIGGGLGATTSLLAANKLAEVRILNLPLGGRKLVVGPVRSLNFPHVVFNRARLHHALVASRTHAERTALVMTDPDLAALPALSPAQRRALEICFARLRRGWAPETAQDRLAEVIADIFAADDEAGRPSPPPAGPEAGSPG